MSVSSAPRSATVETTVVDGPTGLTALDWPADCGGECVFLGRTRAETHPQYGPLVRLEYEVYSPMAEKLLEKMAATAVRRFGCRVVRIAHARGPIDPGQVSVVIQVATPHRHEAFDACRYLIDRLKHELPVWKRQMWQHGQTFVEGCCVGSGKDGADDPASPS